MSRQSDAKRARRRKRQTAQSAVWLPKPVFEELTAADDDAEAIGDAVADIDEWMTARGWVLDVETAVDLVSWVYPPSAADFVDDGREPVTRIWITVDEGDDEVLLEFGAVLVGAGGEDVTYLLHPDNLADHVAALEAYRPGLPRPEFE